MGGFPVTEFDRGIFDLPRLFRLLCVCLGVTVMVAVQMHGVQNNQHRIEHGLQFPGVSYEDAADLAHDHDHSQSHDAVTSDDASTAVLAVDVADDGGKSPLSHHHHNGGDIHVALATPVHPTGAGVVTTLDLGPAPDAVPPGAILDAPHQPPRQNA
ncbi:hypothetical protein [Brevundimonas diminuta]|uniref:hypothetical protein n=1 Tax=Brevundimonas diminuta TaxID=293 RepID=UPI00215B7852|nr:hypothetical protein [Brevundimonas diminuta]